MMRHEWDPRLLEEPDTREPKGQCASDLALIEGIQDGSRTSLRILMQRYWSPLVNYASAVTESRDDAEDVVQEAFVQVWRRRGRWTFPGAVKAYLYNVTRNLALNAHGAPNGGRTRDARRGNGLPGHRNLEKDFETVSLRAEVDAAIAALPKRRREIFVLSRFHGLTHQEIADTLRLSHQAVADHMGLALADLRRTLSEHLHVK